MTMVAFGFPGGFGCGLSGFVVDVGSSAEFSCVG